MRITVMINPGFGNIHTGYAGGRPKRPGSITHYSISGFTIRKAGGTGNDCISFSYIESGEINDNNILNSKQSDGIQLGHCKEITIENNQISNHDAAGIRLTRTEDCIINNNVIQNNQIGLFLNDNTIENIISNNDITGNSQYGVQIGVSYFQPINNRFYLN